MKLLTGLSLIVLFGAMILGCPTGPYFPKLRLTNNSDRTVSTFIGGYPDSSLRRSIGDIFLPPKKSSYVGSIYKLDESLGVTLFIFDNKYVRDQWHEGVGTPDTWLDEDRILKKFYFSKSELDSIKWRLVYP